MKPLRIAAIGCGYIMQAEHVPGLLALQPEIVLAATVDATPERARAIAALFHAPAFDSLEAALAGAAFDAVLIATPAPTHAALPRLAVAVAQTPGHWIGSQWPIWPTLCKPISRQSRALRD